RDELARLPRHSGDRRATVVVYVRAAAAVVPTATPAPGQAIAKTKAPAAAGPPRPQVFLLPADANPADPHEGDPGRPGAWVRLNDVLVSLKDCGARQKLL